MQHCQKSEKREKKSHTISSAKCMHHDIGSWDMLSEHLNRNCKYNTHLRNVLAVGTDN